MRHVITIELREERAVFLRADHLADCSIGQTVDMFDKETAKDMDLVISQDYTIHYGVDGLGMYMSTVKEFDELFGSVTTKDPVEIFRAMISIDKIRARVCMDIICQETFQLVVCGSKISWKDAKDALSDVCSRGKELKKAKKKAAAVAVVESLAAAKDIFFTADVPPY